MSIEPAPPVLQPPGTDQKSAHTTGSSGLRRFLLWGLSLLLLLILVLVILILPKTVSLLEQADQVPQTRQQPVQPVLPAASDAIVARQEAELSLQKFLRLRAHSELSAVEHWASESWSGIMQLVESGDRHYGHHRYREAQQAYETAANRLQDLQQQRPQLIDSYLAEAAAALQENRIVEAMAGYQNVLAMQAHHPLAEKGLARTRVREQLLAQMQHGQQAHSEGRLQAALESYEAAIALDPDYTTARSARQEVKQLLQEQIFTEAMSKGLANIQSGDLKAAGEALETATGIYPDDPALIDARKRLVEAGRVLELNRYRQQANELVRQEKWREAVAVYRKARALDSGATFAQSGQLHAEQRARLHDQLAHYLDKPERLFSEAPLNNARKLLAANPTSPLDEPVLANQLDALREAVRVAGLPVSLRIESDALTEVTIYHVGRLGSFLNRELELTPGDYTVVGSRNGYRDVRKVIRLEPGSPSATVLIRCEEPI